MDISIEEIREEIKNIISHSDLSTISPKSLRASLEKKFQTDLSERKSSIDEIIVEELKASKIESDDGAKKRPIENKTEESDESNSEDDEVEPNVKKTKTLSDEELARQIQSEESEARPTRKAAPKQSGGRKVKEKTSSNGSTALGATSKKSAFAKDCCLSKELSGILGKEKCPRSEVVKGMWKYFKDNNLLDPSNKQFVICDDKLMNVFGKKKFKAFGMMKDLKKHIFDETNE